MSGHYATLLRSTVKSLIADCEVYITDWHNARDIPVSEGKFDIEDYTLYLVNHLRHLGSDTHVIAVCQPVPLALAATAYMAQEDPKAQPLSLTLIGGPIDPDANPTDVTDYEAKDELELHRAMLEQAMDVLNPREKDILIKRRLDEQSITLEDLSEEYNVSRERIRQIEVRAFEKLQQEMRRLAVEKGMLSAV